MRVLGGIAKLVLWPQLLVEGDSYSQVSIK